MKISGIPFLVFSVFLFCACDDSRIYETNHDLAEKTWNEDTIPGFTFNISDTQKPYHLYYNIRNTRAYPFHNLYLRYTLEDSVGQVLSSELHNINLFDPKSGKPYGDGLGDIYDHQIMAIENYRFNHPGTYRFKIQHDMRLSELPEIMSVGLRVERAEGN